MNILQLTTAAEQLRSAHQFTIAPKDRLEIQHAHTIVAAVLQRMGVFIGFVSEKTSAPTKNTHGVRCVKCQNCQEPNNPQNPSCFNCGEKLPDFIKPPIMDEDDTRRDLQQLCREQQEKIATLSSENDSWRVDSQMLADICNLLTEAMPGFKGVPSTPEWTVAAVRELLEQRAELQGAAHRAAVRLESGKLEEVKQNSQLAKDLRAVVSRVNKTLREA